MSSEETFNTIVIGGGQAGLAAGYYLSQRGENYVILDENTRTGATWRKRWDSLRLFTPSQNDYLPGMKFPGYDNYFPTKDEAADFLETYASHFSLPVRYGVKVDGLQRNEAGYRLSAGEERFHARNVIVATGAFHTPYTPNIAQGLTLGIFQMHSVDYRRPKDVPVQNVVVVGAGNSGAEIGLELAKDGRKVWLAGRDVGHIPANKLGKLFGGKPYWWFLRRVMTIHTPLGRRMKANVLAHGNPLVRIPREEVAGACVEFVPRLTGVWDGKPQTEDGRMLPVQGVVWATGFRPDYYWINLPIFDGTGRPRHQRGVVPEAPGLYFVGLHFQTGLTSSLLGGVGEDARYIVRQMRLISEAKRRTTTLIN
jgi:putative flavoprotein involved in K+ transport